MVPMINPFKKNDKFEITNDQLRHLINEATLPYMRSYDEALDQVIKIMKVHKLSVALSRRSLEIIERIKDRYPYIWNECTDESDTAFVADLLKQLGE